MKPKNLQTKIFLDGGDAAETKAVVEALGWLDGQTTNPSLIAKNPSVLERLSRGQLFEVEEIRDFYRGIVETASKLIPDGSISIEVTADSHTTTEEMLAQAHEMNAWIGNAHIKFPTVAAGLAAAETFTAEGGRVNMTLCFSQLQAAAVYVATKNAQRGNVFVSPFVGRFDDRGERGIDTIANIQRMYSEGDGHVMVLAASIRSKEHLQWCLSRNCDIITAPANLLLEWAADGMPVPPGDYSYNTDSLTPLSYAEVPLNQDWQSYNIQHDLTDQGLLKFEADWNGLLGRQ